MGVPGNAEDKKLTPEEQQRLERFKQSVLIEKRIGERMKLIRHKFLVASGKGGVGKTTAAVNLALALADMGDTVALLDADIHGPGVPFLLGMKNVKLTGTEGGLEPIPFNDRLSVMSMAFLLEDDADAVIWRGPLKMAMIDNLLADVNWGERDWLVIDTPPGTGDEILSLAQRIKPLDGVVMVTTPQQAAVNAARKTLSFAKSIKIPVLGVIENMAPFACPGCGRAINLFGEGGGEKVAADAGVPFLGAVPFDPESAAAGDGKTARGELSATATGAIWRSIAEKIKEKTGA